MRLAGDSGLMLGPILGAALLAVTGCAPLTRNEYAAPELLVAPSWELQASGSHSAVQGSWWEQFGDQQMSAFVERVLRENGDLIAAGIRLRQARMSADLAATELLPTISGNLSSGASRSLEGKSDWAKSSSASLGASWEVDLFGRLNAQRNASAWEAAATAEDLAATQLALAGTAATAWWQLAYANERIALGDESLGYTLRALVLVQKQYDAGAVSRLEVRDAEQSVAAQEASLIQLNRARSEARHALAALVGVQDYDGPEPEMLPATELPAIDAGVPAELLGRRPDLAAAELRLRSSLANADATIASFYPQLNLTGSLGTASDALLDLFAHPAASLGAALSLPFLNPERMRLQTGIAREDYRLAVTQFRQTFYNSLRDVADALALREQLVLQEDSLARSYEAAADSEQLYERQYRAGAVALRGWLDAQERLRNARSNLLENRFNQLAAQIALYQAFGGHAAIGSNGSAQSPTRKENHA